MHSFAPASGGTVQAHPIVTPLLPGALSAAHAAGLATESIVVIDGAPGHPSLADLLQADAAPPALRIDPATHVAVLPYSSGTTAAPKGVMLSHRNLVANVQQARDLIGVVPEDKVRALLPFYHIYGMTVLLNLAFKQRAALVTMAKFDFAEFLKTIQDHRSRRPNVNRCVGHENRRWVSRYG
jgi:4-coumarate--CoA ligase